MYGLNRKKMEETKEILRTIFSINRTLKMTQFEQQR